jgi:hypothetical protein
VAKNIAFTRKMPLKGVNVPPFSGKLLSVSIKNGIFATKKIG